MGLFDKLFKKNNSDKSIETLKIETGKDGNSIAIGDISKKSFSNGHVGSFTGNQSHDFYVYEWFIKETGEIFYVGKGRGDRYKEYHERAYEAEKIRKQYDTGIKFIKMDLSEEEALNQEAEEITRILNETNDRLTNRNIPFFTKRDNGYSRSPSTPPFKFETAPVLFACEIDEHYFGVKHRPFDKVEYNNLSHPAFIEKNISKEQIEIIYGGDYDKYYKETVALLEQNGNKLIKTKYAKSITAWIYPCDDYVTNYELDEKAAEEKIGRRVPAYHLIDVWKYLKTRYGNIVVQEQAPVEINPINNRVPLREIKNLNDWEKGFDAGYKYWEEGEVERKAGNIERAIQLYDSARYNGYSAPALYKSYAMAFRKAKDLDNEIAILNEAIDRYQAEEEDYSQVVLLFEDQRKKAIEKFQKARNV